MTVFLDGFEVLCVDVLIWVFQQGALQRPLCVPGLRPGLQVLLYCLGDSFVMRSHNLGSILPVHLRKRETENIYLLTTVYTSAVFVALKNNLGMLITIFQETI